ncbi:hypothetical protein [Alkalilimnicola ehrlichii]|nr:hypothetical protein [Alkalilimnicola ehrlichii]
MKKAYIDSRYDKKYAVTREDLDWLGERVEKLQALAEQSCRERIQNF